MVEAKLKRFSIELLNAGDVLDADLYDGRLLLLPAGTVITDSFITKLRERRLTMLSSNSTLLQQREEKLAELRVRDQAILEQLVKAEAELHEAAGFVQSISDELVSTAQQSVDSFYKCLAEAEEPDVEDVNGHAKVILERALELRGQERVVHNLMDMKSYDPYTYTHSVNVSGLFAMVAADELETAENAQDIVLGSLLHDAGKVQIPVQILTKPGRLTPEEYEVMKTHTVLGHEMLKDKLGMPPEVYQAARSHHERFDGSGYPDGLARDEIQEHAGVLAVCDVFEALVTKRTYKPKIEPSAAVRILAQSSGSHFAPMLVSKFMRTLGLYPNGTYVELSDGRLGMVVAQTAALLRPRVAIIGSPDAGIVYEGIEVDLSKDMSISISRALNTARL
jgi:putative nucleotidyltransferase with HDIG domain